MNGLPVLPAAQQGLKLAAWRAPCPAPQDVAELEARLGRKLEKAERARIGVGQLRRFLEHLLQVGAGWGRAG